MKRRARTLAAARPLRCIDVVVAGCGSDDDNTAGATTAAETAGTTTDTSAGPAIKVGLVTDIGGLDDRSFNFLANKGLDQAERELGVQGRVVVSRTNADYVPNLTSLAKAKYDLVIAVGFLMADALDTVAKQFPDTNFAIIDFDQTAMKSKPKNVRGLLFKEQEAGYLVGYLAGLVDQRGGGLAAGDRLGRRAEDSAGRPVHRGLPGGRQKGQPGDHDAERLLAGFRRPGEVQRARTRPDRARGARRSFRSPASAVSVLSPPRRRRTSAGSASTPTRRTSASTSSRAR